ncbi:ATP-binding cassette domain-containing protein [Idiomarina loihiensis]|jgi:sodium transport system ATP-binding protein|uniref:ABC-type Na+ transport system, ATPase component n=1 Tax=Idiomarina loihiensis (strain ATCC BAA-735 / DSM 15497 / L2-TR) TaxID=283942 RepID=Q5R035_IDILO|nr:MULTISPECIES: ATP-binding cassette domain-containing protein [Idiomarina]NWO01620.1 ATP-binding cassette domain-containing protein [Idiomarinaceae bacterium]AAV81324.1 ABC-type Na+ transport system, ATPase component [Idiomarina loihiensis L2TR]AGM35348.1 ABC transporter-like protein [Idiomarina loihiensis GSL 199]MRJ45223.1 ATP-binding cassette domain-containing protein [Idiomarina loihiensis]PHQ88485.1 MAG: ABC transporter [Idiomarina sp.]|tara:strand:- start:8247 stop:8981 length:735 start_codon:yes stop_codon:yes gene_type:complete
MINVDALTKTFKNVQALDSLSFQAKDGEITGLLGPNGAGKTTCLRIIYGLLQADTGKAEIEGVDANQNPIDARRNLGIFPDKFGLYERLTVREQVAYFAGLHGLKGTEQKQAVEKVIEKLDIKELADRRTAGFSQGQRMKVALAQALVHSPKHLILDEPSRGLDVMSTRILRDVLREQRAQGTCILFSSHVMQEVAALCDRVVVMAKGKVAAEGTPQELCDMTGEQQLEDAFVKIIGTDEGIAA